MDKERRALLVEIMQALGDDRDSRAALVRFYLEFGSEIAAIVRFEVKQLGGRHLGEDDIEGLTFDACSAIAVANAAGAWRPSGGALPWVWARSRIRQIVVDQLGPRTVALSPAALDRLEAAGEAATAVADDEVMTPVLLRLAEVDATCELVHDALATALGAREAEVLLRYRVQQQAGDPAPSNTVANALGVTPDAVRQTASRARRKLERLIDRDPAFDGLRGLALLAA